MSRTNMEKQDLHLDFNSCKLKRCANGKPVSTEGISWSPLSYGPGNNYSQNKCVQQGDLTGKCVRHATTMRVN